MNLLIELRDTLCAVLHGVHDIVELSHGHGLRLESDIYNGLELVHEAVVEVSQKFLHGPDSFGGHISELIKS